MDGTLTVPLNKSKRIRAQLNIPSDIKILNFISNISDEKERTKAWSFIEEVEAECCPKMRLKPQVTELLLFLHINKASYYETLLWLTHFQIKLALMTEGSIKSIDHFQSLLYKEDSDLPECIFSYVSVCTH